MKQVGKFKLYTSEEVLEEAFGPIGTPERDKFEAEVAEAVHTNELGEAIKKARLQQNLTQEQLGARVSVKRAPLLFIPQKPSKEARASLQWWSRFGYRPSASHVTMMPR